MKPIDEVARFARTRRTYVLLMMAGATWQGIGFAANIVPDDGTVTSVSTAANGHQTVAIAVAVRGDGNGYGWVASSAALWAAFFLLQYANACCVAIHRSQRRSGAEKLPFLLIF
jgi:hypothetical protein